jgi:Predicted acyltransferase
MFKRMILPDKTKMGDGSIVCEGDILIGNYSKIGYGLIGENVFVGERTDIEGEIEARKDLRVGAFSTVNGDVYVEGDAYLAERVKICGKLILLGNLDIGDDVKIDGGFESKGWIVIRNLPPLSFSSSYI